VVSYEVFGKVQHVYMRKYTKLQGEKLGLIGWVENTAAGTVRGEVCGDEPAVEQFKAWAETEGAPKAKPHHAEFSMAKEVDRAEAEKLFPKGFEVRRTLLSNGKQWA